MSGVYDFSGGFGAINSALTDFDEMAKAKKKKKAAAEGLPPQMHSIGDITAGASLLQLQPVAMQQAQRVKPVQGFVRLRGA